MTTKRAWVKRAAVLGTCVQVWACGGEPVQQPEPAVASAGAERAPAAEEEPMQVEGLKGTLTKLDVERALEPRMLKFAVCPGKSSDLEFITGEMAFHFTVAPDGRVVDVVGTRSTLGDRATERCMLKAARGAKFRKPRGGGEAEFDWSLEIPENPDVRAPVAWDAEQVASTIEESGAALLESCGGGAATVTAYVDTDGSVMAAGAVDGEPGSEARLDCLIAGVEGWAFESPGSYPAKVTFVLQ